MDKRAPNLEWQFAENDADWEHRRAQLLPEITPNDKRYLHLKRYLWIVATLLLLVCVGGWLWRTDQARARQANAKMKETEQPALDQASFVTSVIANLTATDRDQLVAQAESSLRVAIQTNAPAAHVEIALPLVEIQADHAVARLVISNGDGTPTYRQTRFYRRTDAGWVHTAPDVALWGLEHSLETPSFVYHFRQHDAAAVIAAAPQVDALYRIMGRNFGLPLTPTPAKLVINVNVTQSPGQVLSPYVPDRINVSSPALYLAPDELTDTDLLLQSIALLLIEQEEAKARARYGIGSSWKPLLGGLRLWQVWELDLPLSVWREELVRWIYHDLLVADHEQAAVLPDHYLELCAAYKLWLPSPTWMNIPLVCTELDQEAWFFASWGPRDSLTRLDQFSMPASQAFVEPPFPLHHPGQTVILATLIGYAVTTYGRERLPALVAGLGQYDTWDTLLPAVYGVSAAEFEADWQAYLERRYGVPPDPIMP